MYNQPFGISQNPYGNMFQPQMSGTSQQVIRVNGENGAKAFNMPPNSSALLLDETEPIVWLKQTDGAGYPSITPYKIEPYTRAPEPDYNSLEARIARLEGMINGKSNSSEAE